MIHEYWAGRVNAVLGPPAVVVQAVEEEPPAPPLVATSYAPTVKVFEPVEALALTEVCGPWAAALALFNPIGGDADVA